LKSVLFSFTFLLLSSTSQAQKKVTANDGFSQMVNDHLNYTVPVIKVEDLYRTKTEIVLLDAREIEEYNVSHIRNAIHIGYKDFNKVSLKNIDKNKKIIVYCSIGYRSEKIGEQLISMGYKHVYNLYGSLFAWVNRGYEVVDVSNRPTFNVHGYNASWSKWITNKKYKKVY
jgi:rhodanese-related sulfurtransferase